MSHQSTQVAVIHIDELKHVRDRGLVRGPGRCLNIEYEPPTETFTDDFINLHIIFIKLGENHIVKLTQYTNQIPKLPLPHINL